MTESRLCSADGPPRHLLVQLPSQSSKGQPPSPASGLRSLCLLLGDYQAKAPFALSSCRSWSRLGPPPSTVQGLSPQSLTSRLSLTSLVCPLPLDPSAGDTWLLALGTRPYPRDTRSTPRSNLPNPQLIPSIN